MEKISSGKNRHKPKKKDLQAILKFRNEVDTRGFKPIPLENKVKDIVEKERVKPKVATINNVLQDQYECPSLDGYLIRLITGTKDGVINPTGSAWVHIVNRRDKKIVTREFYKTSIKNILKRLSIYAHVFKNMMDSKPRGMHLIEATETELAWSNSTDSEIIPIYIENYVYGLAKEDQKFVLKNESKRNSYLRCSAGKIRHRQREIKKTWNR